MLDSGLGELQAELGFADARRANDDGERAWQQAAAKLLVEFRNSSGKARGIRHGAL